METSTIVEWPLAIPDSRTNFYSFMRLCLAQREYAKVLDLWEEASEEMWRFGYWNDYARCGHTVLEMAYLLGDEALEGDMLNRLGYLYMEKGEFNLAHKYFHDSLAVFTKLHDTINQSRVLRDLGTLALRCERPGDTLRYYTEALKIIASEKPSTNITGIWIRREAELHSLRGNLYLKLKDYTTAGQEILHSLEMYRTIRDEYLYFQIGPLLNLGRWFQARKDLHNAENAYIICVEISQKLGRTDTISGALIRLSALEEAKGHSNNAQRLVNRAEQIAGTEQSYNRNIALKRNAEIAGSKLQKLKSKFDSTLSSWREMYSLIKEVPGTTIKSALASVFVFPRQKAELNYLHAKLTKILSEYQTNTSDLNTFLQQWTLL